jgi:hypothetical protein
MFWKIQLVPVFFQFVGFIAETFLYVYVCTWLPQFFMWVQMLYDRTLASQDAVLSTLIEEMSKWVLLGVGGGRGQNSMCPVTTQARAHVACVRTQSDTLSLLPAHMPPPPPHTHLPFCRQRIRELFLCYCTLLHADAALMPEALDARCEALLLSQFGLAVDFTCEEALPALLEVCVCVLSFGDGDREG